MVDGHLRLVLRVVWVIPWLVLPSSGAQDIPVGGKCGLFVQSPAAPDQRPPFCAEDHHLEWWEECAHAILGAEPQRPASGDPWSVVTQSGEWAPADHFAERFVAECKALRSAAEAEGVPLVQSGWTVSPHDPSRCPCAMAEHRAFVEGCLAELEAILPGMKRWEVMERFRRDGGITVGGEARLRHCTCRLLKVDVGFDLPPGASQTSPRDLVRSVGNPYLEYPFAD
jgi:hypothetical protein